MIETSPTEYIQPPHGQGKKRRRAPSDDEIANIIASVDLPFGLYAYLLIYTGCRRCEALGLQYKHIDRENNLIHIMQTVYFKSNRAALKKPKSDKGIRDIILLDVLKEKIPEGNPEDFIFNLNGKPLSKSQFAAAWERYTAASGVNELTPHIVRASPPKKKPESKRAFGLFSCFLSGLCPCFYTSWALCLDFIFSDT